MTDRLTALLGRLRISTEPHLSHTDACDQTVAPRGRPTSSPSSWPDSFDWAGGQQARASSVNCRSSCSTQIKLGFEVTDAQRRADETARVQTALNCASTNVMMADADLNVIYMNDAIKKMFQEAEADLASSSCRISTLMTSLAKYRHVSCQPFTPASSCWRISKDLSSELPGRRAHIPYHRQSGDQRRFGASRHRGRVG